MARNDGGSSVAGERAGQLKWCCIRGHVGCDGSCPSATPMSVLEEAQVLIHGDREKDYGHPSVNFAYIAALWTEYMRHNSMVVDGFAFNEQDICHLMVLLKVARDRRGYKRDTAVDIAGYAGLKERLHSGV